MFLTENTIPEVYQVLCASQVVLLFFYHSGFFPHISRVFPRSCLTAACALLRVTALWLRKGRETWDDIAGHWFEAGAALRQFLLSQSPPTFPSGLQTYWGFFFLPLSPLVKKIYRACPSPPSKDRACGRKAAKRCWILSGFISLHLSCQLYMGRDFLLISHNCRKESFCDLPGWFLVF